MTSAPTPAESHSPAYCAWCGSVPEEPSFVDGSLACSDCATEAVFGGLLNRFNPMRRRIPPAGLTPAVRYGSLFEAARTLLRVNMGEEDRVFPTLAFAAEVGEGFLDLATAKERLVAAQGKDDEWQLEVEEFARACPAYRP